MSYQLTNSTIQQISTLSLTIQPQLLYTKAKAQSSLPTITITLSDSQITSLGTCTGCTLTSAKRVTLTYFAVSMLITLHINNSHYPKPIAQTILLQIKSADNTFVYQTYSAAYTLDPMKFTLTSVFSGLYGQIGSLLITLTDYPKETYTLKYSNDSTIFQNSTVCQACTPTSLTLKGKIIYFQATNITIQGQSTYNNVPITLAQSTFEVKYTCYSIPGCRICVNQTVQTGGNQTSVNTTSSNSSTQTLICTKCFDKSLTSSYLMYNKACVSSCPVSTYSTNLTCEKCQVTCFNCTVAQCLQCITNYYVYQRTCVKDCPLGFTRNSTHCISKPIICPSNCINCPQDYICLQCDSSYKLYNNLCYTQCPSGFKTSKRNSTSCEIFIPPQQSKFFPFAFVICSILFLILLAAIKCFQRRSLMIGNFISIISLLQFGSFITTLVYTLTQVQINIFIQALIFIIVLSKILLNISFLIYFMKSIRPEKQFSQWLSKYQQNQYIYKISLIVSCIISFNVIRLIYSRFMGLKIFFGKFSSGLIFKPINFFSVAGTIVYSAPLIILCVNDINLQEGYKTKIYYSAIETIVMEILIVGSWILDWKRGASDQFFDFQIYKIENQFQDSMVNPIGIGAQHQFGGSTQQVLKSYRKFQQQANKKPVEWKRKTIPYSEGALSIQQEDQMLSDDTLIPIEKKKSLFKMKIINDWRQIQKELPNLNQKFRQLRKSRNYISKSPNTIRKSSKSVKKLKKVSSLQKLNFPMPFNLKSPQKIQNNFYKLYQESEINDGNPSVISSIRAQQVNSSKKNKYQQVQNIKVASPLKSSPKSPVKNRPQSPMKYRLKSPIRSPEKNSPKKQEIKEQFIAEVSQQNQFEKFQLSKKQMLEQSFDIHPITLEQMSGEQKPKKQLQKIAQKSQKLNNENLEQILDQLTDSNANRNFERVKSNNLKERNQNHKDNHIFETFNKQSSKQKKIAYFQPQFNQSDDIEESKVEPDYQQIEQIDQQYSNRKFKNSNFTRSTSNVPQIHKSFDGSQNRHNNLIARVKESSSRENQLDRMEFEFASKQSRPQIKHLNASSDNSKLISQANYKSQNDISNQSSGDNDIDLYSKRKKSRHHGKKSKPQSQIEKLYLQRLMNQVDDKKSLSKKKRLKNLANF